MTAPFTNAPLTDAEQAVLDRLGAGGVHLVHFWAPWCPDVLAELEGGFAEAVARAAERGVHVTFVTMWSEGASGRDVMREHGLPESVVEISTVGDGTREDKAGRRRHFLGLPMTWIPSTWLFRDGGELAYAFNYGALTGDDLDRALGWVGA